jgi:hypothetical protein
VRFSRAFVLATGLLAAAAFARAGSTPDSTRTPAADSAAAATDTARAGVARGWRLRELSAIEGDGAHPLVEPDGVLSDAFGHIWVSDASLHKLRRWRADGVPLDETGALGSEPTQFRRPGALARVGALGVAVLDVENRRVSTYDHNLRLLSIAVDLASTDLESRAGSVRPLSLASDRGGALYVVDAERDRILVFDYAGAFQREVGGYGGRSGSFSGLTGVAVTARGRIVTVERPRPRSKKADPSDSTLARARIQWLEAGGRLITSVWSPPLASGPLGAVGVGGRGCDREGGDRRRALGRGVRALARRRADRAPDRAFLAARAGVRGRRHAARGRDGRRPRAPLDAGAREDGLSRGASYPFRGRGARRLRVRRGCRAGACGTRGRHARAQRDPSCTVFPIVPTSGAALMRLPRGFIRAGSDSVWSRQGGWARDRDYRLDRLRGDLRLLRTWAPGETLWVSVCGLLAPPGLEYSRQVYQPARPVGAIDTGATAGAAGAMPATTRPATGRDPSTAPSGSALAVNGNKTLAVEFGSAQDAALRQSLDLSLSGRISPGVEITGVLSDRDTPLSAAGATQDLQSLDRVLVEVKAKDGAGALGDIPVTLTRSEFGRLERRVQGVAGEWHPGDLSVRAAAAGAQGEYNRLQFVGVDGLQGPYQLTDRDGNAGITIVAGSEVVTVDGARMTRGEAADYAIDYDRARVTFSNRRPISSASRITVEYQYALTRFRRNLAMFSSEWKHGGWSWYAQGITEGDDAGRPLSGALDATDRLRLSQSGDSLALGVGVTPGVGDYDSVRVGTTLHFAFAGLDSGAFAVQFARVGDGVGDYADSGVVGGRTVYHYVGPRLGAFQVGRSLPAPMTQRLAAVGTSLAAGAMRLDVEGAGSFLDRNTLSALDDGDDLGGAGRALLSSEGRLGIVPGRAGIAAGFRAVDKRFAPFSRLEQPFAEEDWGLPAGSDLEHQRRADASAWWRLSTGNEVKAEVAHLTLPDGFRGMRQRADAQLQAAGFAVQGAWLQANGTSSQFAFPDGGRTRAVGSVLWRGGWLSPSLRGDDDRRRTPSDTATIENSVRSLDADLASGAACRSASPSAPACAGTRATPGARPRARAPTRCAPSWRRRPALRSARRSRRSARTRATSRAG